MPGLDDGERTIYLFFMGLLNFVSFLLAAHFFLYFLFFFPKFFLLGIEKIDFFFFFFSFGLLCDFGPWLPSDYIAFDGSTGSWRIILSSNSKLLKGVPSNYYCFGGSHHYWRVRERCKKREKATVRLTGRCRWNLVWMINF